MHDNFGGEPPKFAVNEPQMAVDYMKPEHCILPKSKPAKSQPPLKELNKLVETIKTSNYSNKDVLFTTSISHRRTNCYTITGSFLHRNLSKRRRTKRHKRPCFYYPNSSAAFNMELIGDLTFKLNPGPSVNRTIPVIVSSQAKRSHALRPATVLYNATLGSKNCCPRGVNWHNLISIRCSKQKLQNGFVPIDFCLLNTRSIKDCDQRLCSQK